MEVFMVTQPIPNEKVHDTKEVILMAATKLFAHQGYDGTSIRDIVEEAGVTKPVLYYYFKNKEDLYIYLINDAYHFLFTEIRTVVNTTKSFITRLKELVHLYISCHEHYDDTVRIIYNAAFGTSRNHPKVNLQKLEEEHIRMIAAFMREGIGAKVLRKIPVQSLVMHFLGIVTAHTNYRLLHIDINIKDTEKTIVQLFLEGTGAAIS
jgi:AcrR family transcriptional regulator